MEDTITAYGETCQLRYNCEHISSRDASSVGAAIVYFDQATDDNKLTLVAIHMCSRFQEDELVAHIGISIPSIFHAIAGKGGAGYTP